jgi:predicted GNAT family N-acyltransferase
VSEVEIQQTRGAAPAGARTIRRRVFVEEQGVARNDEWDEHDVTGSDAIHFVALARDGRPLGCARLRAYGDEGKVERVAVLPEQRRSGLGRRLMIAVEDAAARSGRTELVLHAQTAVIPFYERLGWLPEGPEFHEVDIAHRKMRKTLPA